MPLDIIDFPPGPVAAQKYTSPSGALYMFDGKGWIATYMLRGTSNAPILSAVPHLTTSPYPPPSPAINDLWYSTISGFLFLWYNDGNTIQWVVANPGIGSEIGPQGPIGSTGPAGPQGVQGVPGPRGPTADQSYARVEAFGGGNGIDDSQAFRDALLDGRLIALDSKTTYRVKNVIIPATSKCPGIVSLGGHARITPPDVYVKDDYFFIINKERDFSFDGLFFDMPLNLDPFMNYRFNRAIWWAPTSKRGRNYRVENCTLSGGYIAMSGGGYIVEDSRFSDNHVSGTLGDGFSFNAVINVEFTDNVFEDNGIAAAGASVGPSGAIRTGTDDQLDGSLNLTIARNIITRCCIPKQQSAIDCFSGAARNIRITDNICSYNGGGIELKTIKWVKPAPLPPGASDVYEDNVIANNTIRMFSTVNATGITVFHAGDGSPAQQSPKGKARNVKIAGNIISSTEDVAVGAIVHYAISVEGHDNVLIDSNQIFNVGHGIAVGGTGPVGDVADNIVISNNMVDVVEVAVQHSGGTINHLYIRNNPLLRVSAANTASAVEIAQPSTDLEIAGNRIENLATGRQALNLRATTDARISDNTIIAKGVGVTMSTVASDRVKFRDNDVISATASAFDLALGTNIEVQGNNIEVPVGSSTVSGAAPYLAANNIRGLRTVIPDATVRGTLGDIFLDATAATAGWRCTAAGLPATWAVI